MGYDSQATAYYPGQPVQRQYIKYVPVGIVCSHNIVLAYGLWLVGFTGAHRFYFGKPLTGTLWFFTFGLLGIGWLVDLFLIPRMSQVASQRFRPGMIDYSVAWLLFLFLGIFGFHRFYQGKFFTGLLYLLTGGLIGIGWLYDLFTLNEQIDDRNLARASTVNAYAW